jgi:hypothetical protein
LLVALLDTMLAEVLVDFVQPLEQLAVVVH